MGDCAKVGWPARAGRRGALSPGLRSALGHAKPRCKSRAAKPLGDPAGLRQRYARAVLVNGNCYHYYLHKFAQKKGNAASDAAV